MALQAVGRVARGAPRRSPRDRDSLAPARDRPERGTPSSSCPSLPRPAPRRCSPPPLRPQRGVVAVVHPLGRRAKRSGRDSALARCISTPDHRQLPAAIAPRPGTSRSATIGGADRVFALGPAVGSNFGQRQASQRSTRTGILVCVRTLMVSLPSRRPRMPRLPWEAMTMRSQPLFSAAPMITS